MKTEEAKIHTQTEVDEMIAKAIKHDREFCSQVMRALPLGDTKGKQKWIENPKSLRHVLTQQLYPTKGIEETPKDFYEFTISKSYRKGHEQIEFHTRQRYLDDKTKEMMRGIGLVVIDAEEDALIRIYHTYALGIVGWSEAEFLGQKGWEHLEALGLAKCLVDDGLFIYDASQNLLPDRGYSFMVAQDPISVANQLRVFGGRSGFDEGDLFGVNSELVTNNRFHGDELIAVRVANKI